MSIVSIPAVAALLLDPVGALSAPTLLLVVRRFRVQVPEDQIIPKESDWASSSGARTGYQVWSHSEPLVEYPASAEQVAKAFKYILSDTERTVHAYSVHK